MFRAVGAARPLLEIGGTMRILMLCLVAGGCVGDFGETESAVTVGGVGTTCSTSVVIGLSKQIAEEVGCASPGSLVAFAPTAKLTITSNAVLPYLAKNAKADLLVASESGVLQVNSAFRTIAQQYLLYKWYQAGQCGITAAATVGNSNHESGRAVDLANYSARITAMANHGWAHDVPGDDVHFDHLGSADIRGKDTAAFQRLWNRNHPDDKIAEDGAYGAQTASRLAMSPAGGFATGAICNVPKTDVADLVGITGPDKVAPSTQAHYAIAVKNTGTAAWPATTVLVTADAMPSELHDPSWISDTVAAELGASVAAGATTTIELDVTTPAATMDTPIQQLFALRDGTAMFGSFPLALTVVMAGANTSGDSSEGDPTQPGGGCNAGGGASWWVGLAAIALLRRRRGSVATSAARIASATVAVLAACSTRPAMDGPDAGGGDDAMVDAGVETPPVDAAMPKAITVLRGVDRASAFSVAEAKTLHTDHGVEWTGVYIGGACNAGSGWNKSVVTAIHTATQWQFMPIWVGQQSSAICGSHTLTAAQGTSDGTATVAKLAEFGWMGHRDIPVALDVESGTYSSNSAGTTAYVKAWVAAVHAAGYLAYAYSSPTGIMHFHDSATGLDGAWVASWFFSGFHDSKPSDLTQIDTDYDHQNRAWQYAGSFAVSGAGNVDADTSDLMLAPAPGGTNL